MLILEDYWDRNADLRGVPIYQASGLARRALGVFQTYIAMMNEDIKAAFSQVCMYPALLNSSPPESWLRVRLLRTRNTTHWQPFAQLACSIAASTDLCSSVLEWSQNLCMTGGVQIVVRCAWGDVLLAFRRAPTPSTSSTSQS